MNPWETYEARVDCVGRTKREITKRREQRFLDLKMPTSLSYHSLIIDGEPRELAVINSDNLNIKTLHTLPGEDLHHGGYVEWMDNHWLIIEKDANNELYTSAKMQQCNYLLKWIEEDGNIIERWCIVEDGTKLTRNDVLRDGLAYWKRYVKTPSLFAGTPLEPYHRNRKMKYAYMERFKKIRIGQSAAKP